MLCVTVGFYLVGFDLPRSIQAVVHNQASRDYLAWVIYNPYDFFVFMSLPLSLLFIYKSLKSTKKIDIKPIINRAMYTFWIIFALLVFSGASRGEVGRIWLPFMIIPIVCVGQLIADLKLSYKQIAIIFILIFIQTILIEEYWVPIW